MQGRFGHGGPCVRAGSPPPQPSPQRGGGGASLPVDGRDQPRPSTSIMLYSPGLLVLSPQRRLDRAAGEDHPVGGDVAQARCARPCPGEDRVVLADHVAAPERGKADIAALARPGMAVAAPVGDVAQRHLTRPRPPLRPASARCRKGRRPCGGGASRRSRCRNPRPAPPPPCAVSTVSRLTPIDMLPARITVAWRAAAEIRTRSSSRRPVVPMTCTSRAWAADLGMGDGGLPAR